MKLAKITQSALRWATLRNLADRAPWGLYSRILAAVFGGYALAHALPIAIMAMLPVARADAALAAIQLSFLVYVAAILWSFSARSPQLAWAGIGIPFAVSAVLNWILL